MLKFSARGVQCTLVRISLRPGVVVAIALRFVPNHVLVACCRWILARAHSYMSLCRSCILLMSTYDTCLCWCVSCSINVGTFRGMSWTGRELQVGARTCAGGADRSPLRVALYLLYPVHHGLFTEAPTKHSYGIRIVTRR